jgi:hypothetical protein
MVELHERFAEGMFEERSEKRKLHRGEDKQSPHAEEKKSEADKINQIRIELFNMPVLALETPGANLREKPDLKNSDTRPSLLDIIEIILEMIVDGAKAIFLKRKGEN